MYSIFSSKRYVFHILRQLYPILRGSMLCIVGTYMTIMDSIFGNLPLFSSFLVVLSNEERHRVLLGMNESY